MCDRFQVVGGLPLAPHPWAAPKKPILNRVKIRHTVFIKIIHWTIHFVIVVFNHFYLRTIHVSNRLDKISLIEKYSNLKFSTTPGLCLKSLPGKYSYLSSSFDDNAVSFAASVSRSYWAWFAWNFSSRIFSSLIDVVFKKHLKDFF